MLKSTQSWTFPQHFLQPPQMGNISNAHQTDKQTVACGVGRTLSSNKVNDKMST